MIAALLFTFGIAIGYICGGYDGWHNGRRWERSPEKDEDVK